MIHNQDTHYVNNQQGQSLIEVTIAAFGLVVVLVAVVSGILMSVRSSTFSNEQSVATKYAQQGVELFRRFHGELGWDGFYNTILADGSGVITYCLPNVDTVTTATTFRAMTNGACSTSAFITGTRFTRQVTAQITSNDSITVVVTVTWPQGSDTQTAEITQIFRRRQ